MATNVVIKDTSDEYEYYPLRNIKCGEIGIITSGQGSINSGEVVVGGFYEVVFPEAGKFTEKNSTDYFYRKLFPHESVILTTKD